MNSASQFAKWNPKAAILVEGSEPVKPPQEYFKEWLKEEELKGKEVLYLFGIGNGESYSLIKKWLHSNAKNQLVYLEYDLGLIHYFLQTPQAETILTDPQVSLYAIESLDEEEPLFGWLSWSYLGKPLAFKALPSYEKNEPALVKDLEMRLIFDAAKKEEMVDEYLKYGIVYYRNFYRNAPLLAESYDGQKLYGHFQGTPAIICGAGPSLEKNKDLLKGLYDKALIFAGGSSLNALKAAGITPHFGAGIDPNPTYYYRLLSTSSLEVPFFFRLRMHDEALRQVKGKKLYIPGAGGYDTAAWLEEKLGIQSEELDEGHNVVNFCTEIALRLGCSPIIFVGLDLAYTDLKEYAKGVVDNPQMTEEELAKRFGDTSPVIRLDIYGEPVYTQWKWVAESEWITKLQHEHPETPFLNATEGGIGMEHVPLITLQEAIERYCGKEKPLQQSIQTLINQAAFSTITKEKVISCLDELKTDLMQCQGYLHILLEELEISRYTIITQRITQRAVETLQTGKAALAETDLVENEAYSALLEIFNTIMTHLLNRDMQNLPSDEKEKQLKMIELLEKKYQYLLDVIEANLILMKNE